MSLLSEYAKNEYMTVNIYGQNEMLLKHTLSQEISL